MRLFLVGAMVLLFTGCSKCTKDTPPPEEVPVSAEQMEGADGAPYPGEGDMPPETGDDYDQISKDEEDMDRQYEQDNDMRDSGIHNEERRKSLGNIPIDHPGTAKPNEDRD